MPHRSLEAGRVANAKHYAANKEYYAARNKLRREQFRAAILEAKDVPCKDCNIRYPYYVMHFDHLGNKSFNIAATHKISSMKKLLEEIAKCEIVCANCHAKRTHQRLDNISVDDVL
jgi:hypothetical protein